MAYSFDLHLSNLFDLIFRWLQTACLEFARGGRRERSAQSVLSVRQRGARVHPASVQTRLQGTHPILIVFILCVAPDYSFRFWFRLHGFNRSKCRGSRLLRWAPERLPSALFREWTATASTISSWRSTGRYRLLPPFDLMRCVKLFVEINVLFLSCWFDFDFDK